jgi:hypothetical protein
MTSSESDFNAAFKVNVGLIAGWRDYFDASMFKAS